MSEWLKDNPWAYSALAVLFVGTIYKVFKSFFNKIWVRFKFLWSMRKRRWLPSSNDVKFLGRTRILFQSPASVRLDVPIEIGFEITGKVKLVRRVLSTDGPHPDFRINLRPLIDRYPYCFIICPWETSERNSNYFECHMDWTPGPQEGSGERLRQVELCPVRKMPFSFTFTMRFTDKEFYFQCSLGEQAEFAVPMSELKARNYPVSPQYISFHAANSVTRLTRIRIKRIS